MTVKETTILLILLQLIYNTKTLQVNIDPTCLFFFFFQITHLQNQLAALKADLEAKEEAEKRKEAE